MKVLSPKRKAELISEYREFNSSRGKFFPVYSGHKTFMHVFGMILNGFYSETGEDNSLSLWRRYCISGMQNE